MERSLIADFSQRVGPDDGMTEFFKCPVNNCYAREPVVVKMANGTLVCVFLAGGPTEPHNKNVVLIKRSYDDGKTWTDTEVLFSHRHVGLWPTELYMGGEKPMLVVSMYNADCPFKMLQTFVSYTEDNGETWSKPTMADPAMCTTSIRRGFKMSNGETLFALYYVMARDGFQWDVDNFYKPGWWDGQFSECAVAVSSDDGKTFTRYGRIWQDGASLWEPNCIELEPGHIVMLIRHDSTGVMGRCDSYDYGRTWGEYHLTDIPNAGSKITAFTINGKACVIGNFNGKARNHLQMRISSDGLKSWEKIISLDDDEKMFTYPHVHVDEQNQMLYIAYENYVQHYLLKISFEEAGLI